jgi:hypothetical protein
MLERVLLSRQFSLFGAVLANALYFTFGRKKLVFIYYFAVTKIDMSKKCDKKL